MKKIFSAIILSDDWGDPKEAMAFNYKQYSKEQCIDEFRLEFPDTIIQDYEPFITYYRYITKVEIIADGDWEFISGYEDGSLSMYEKCEPNDKGAFKCWVIGD